MAELFYQNITNRVGFDNETEALHCTESNIKYSTIDELESSFKIPSINKYEFLMEYPEIGDDYYYQWQQSTNPLEESESQALINATGFNLIHYPKDEKETVISIFRGLVKTTGATARNPLALLNGQPSKTGISGWNFGVGIYTGAYYKPQSTSMTMYNIPIGNSNGANSLYLWVKVSGLLYNTSHSYFLLPFYELSLFLQT